MAGELTFNGSIIESGSQSLAAASPAVGAASPAPATIGRLVNRHDEEDVMEIVTGELVSLKFMAQQARDHGVADVIWRGALVGGPDDIELFVGDGEVVVEVSDSGFYLIYVGVNGGDMAIRRFATADELVAAHWDYGDEAGHDMKIVRMGFQYLGEREPPRCIRAYQNLWDPHSGAVPHLQRFALSLENGPTLLFDADHVDAVKVECLPASWTPPEPVWQEIAI